MINFFLQIAETLVVLALIISMLSAALPIFTADARNLSRRVRSGMFINNACFLALNGIALFCWDDGASVRMLAFTVIVTLMLVGVSFYAGLQIKAEMKRRAEEEGR